MGESCTAKSLTPSKYHVDTRSILPRFEGSCMVYTPEWY